MGSDWRRDCFKALSGSLCPKGSKGTSTKRPWALFLDKDLFKSSLRVFQSHIFPGASSHQNGPQEDSTDYFWMNEYLKVDKSKVHGLVHWVGKKHRFFLQKFPLVQSAQSIAQQNHKNANQP